MTQKNSSNINFKSPIQSQTNKNLREKQLVNNTQIIKWLKKRNFMQAKDEYKKTQKELNRDQEILLVFNKFDLDNSGTIELNELYYMFKANGVNISKEELKQLFQLVDTDGSGSLSFEEFKQLCYNPMTEKLFRQWIKRLRKIQKRNGAQLFQQYLPFNMNRLLDHLSCLTKRELLVQKIQKNNQSYKKTDEDIKNFIKLFILDEGSKDSIVKEEVARLIETNLLPRNQLENQNKQSQQQQQQQRRGLERLDSVFLDEITVKELMKIRRMKKKISTLEDISEDDSVCTESSMEDANPIDNQTQKKLERYQSINVSQVDDSQNSVQNIIKNAKLNGQRQALQQYKMRSNRESIDINNKMEMTQANKYNSLEINNAVKKKEVSQASCQSIKSTEESSVITRNARYYAGSKIKQLQQTISNNIDTNQHSRFMHKRSDQSSLQNQSKIQQEIERIKQEQIQQKNKQFQLQQQAFSSSGLLRSKQQKYNTLVNKNQNMQEYLESLKQN